MLPLKLSMGPAVEVVEEGCRDLRLLRIADVEAGAAREPEGDKASRRCHSEGSRVYQCHFRQGIEQAVLRLVGGFAALVPFAPSLFNP